MNYKNSLELEEFKRNRMTIEEVEEESNQSLDVVERIKPYKFKEKKSLTRNAKDEEVI
jgi:hypothetical protein